MVLSGPPQATSSIRLCRRNTYALDQIKALLDQDEVKKFTTAFGIDPMTDLDSLTLMVRGVGTTDSKFLMVTHGKFDANKINTARRSSRRTIPSCKILQDSGLTFTRPRPARRVPIPRSSTRDRAAVPSKEDLVKAPRLAPVRPPQKR